jgi:hypothetical protein
MHAKRNPNSGTDYYHGRASAELAAYLDSQYGIEPGSPAHLAAVAALEHVSGGRPDTGVRTSPGIFVPAASVIAALHLDRFVRDDGSHNVIFIDGWRTDG